MSETLFFTTDKDVEDVEARYRQHQPGEGEQFSREQLKHQISEKLASNLMFQAWEVSNIPLSPIFYYRRQVKNEVVKYVPQYEDDIDLEEITSPRIRRATEFVAMHNLKTNFDQSRIGQTFVQVSLMRQSEETIDEYPFAMTLIQVFEQVGPDLFGLRQIKTNTLQNVEQGNKFLMQSTDRQIPADSLDVEDQRLVQLDRFLTTIGIKDDKVDLNAFLRTVGESKSVVEIDEELKSLRRSAIMASKEYLIAIENGQRGRELDSTHRDLLTQILVDTGSGRFLFIDGVISFETSCGLISASLTKLAKDGRVVTICRNCGMQYICRVYICLSCSHRL